MAAIDQKLIDRINVLAKKKKEGTITPEELKGKQLETSSIVTIVQKVLRILLAVIILKEFVHLI